MGISLLAECKLLLFAFLIRPEIPEIQFEGIERLVLNKCRVLGKWMYLCTY